MITNILIVSNGLGEDSLASQLITALYSSSQKQGITIHCDTFPLVGTGEKYKKINCRVLYENPIFPSHGFSTTSLTYLLKDIKAGALKNMFNQRKKLTEIKDNYSIVIVVGDYFAANQVAKAKYNKIIFIATAHSIRIRKYSFLELKLLKDKIMQTITRDNDTAKYLQNKRVNAISFGNMMMDDPILKNAQNISYNPQSNSIAIIPSSRKDAYENIASINSIISKIKTDLTFKISLAENLSMEKAKENIPQTNTEIISGQFTEIIQNARAAIGMTGTGNEQVAGLGVPIILVKGNKPHTSTRRMNEYKKLLNGSCFICKGTPEQQAAQIEKIITNQELLKQASQKGKEVMGPPGATNKTAEFIIQSFK
ncbi:hypothetical protein ACFL56_01360 [Candidatus Margulisiibacteriota bacterium]